MHLSTNESREDVACSIRSLLMTYQHGVTVAMLARDYEEIECIRIPFEKFNCPSLLVFLKQLNNYVRIERKDGQTLLYPVECEKSKHIAELVKHQRPKNPNKRRFQKPYLNFCANRPQVSINNNLLTQLILGVRQCPHGLPVNYAIQYINQYIHPLQITRPELEHQLKALAHLIAIYGDNIYPIHQIPIFAQPYINFPYIYNKNWNFNRSNNFPQTSTTKPNAERIPSLFEPLKLVDQSSNKIPLIVKGTDNVYKPNDKLKTQSTEVMQNEKTKSDPHRNIPAKLQTCEISNVCEENKTCQTDIKKNESTGQAAKQLEKEKNIMESDRNITRLTQIKLLKLIHKYPNGIWCSELPLLYLREYNTPLTFEKSEYSSLLDFVSNLPNIFHCVKPLNEKGYKLFNAKHSLPHFKSHKGTSYLNDLPLELDLDDFKTSILKEVMGIEDTVKYTSVTKFQKSSNHNKQYEEILISNVISPSFFWIHLCKHSTAFKKFISELKNFYESNNSNYKVPLPLLQRGLNVVCFFKDRWNRGLIKEVCGDSQITISLYDYGIEKKFFPDEIHFLHKSFSNFPVQAIPCSLYNVKPYKSSMWKQDVIWQFVSKTSFPLIATVENIDLEENQLFLVLTDTRTDEDFHINDWLCSEKFGEPGKYFLKNHNFPFSHYKDCLKQKDYCSLSLHYTKSEEDEIVAADVNIVSTETVPNESGNTRSEKYSHRLEHLLATFVKSDISENTLPPLKEIPSVSEDKNISETLKNPICSRLLSLQRLNKLLNSNCNAIEKNEEKNHEDKPLSSKDVLRPASNYSNSVVSSLDGSFKETSSKVSSKESSKECIKQSEIEMPYFGTFASECGGRGKMQTINWQEVLKPKITIEKQQQKSENKISENNIRKNIVKQQEELKEIPPLIQRLLKLQSKQKRT